jgi:uncharacterized membrane protein
MSDSLPPAPPSNEPYAAPGAAAGRRNGLAIASMIIGIVGILFTVYGIIGLIAVILGFVARSQIARNGQSGRGMALAGIILGFVGIVLGILGIIGLSIYGGMHT